MDAIVRDGGESRATRITVGIGGRTSRRVRPSHVRLDFVSRIRFDPEEMAPRGPIAQYDPREDVIFVDATGIDAKTIEEVDAIFDELEAITARYPDRYALVCWKDVQIGSQAIVTHYGKRTIAWQKNVRVVVRYAADDLVRSHIRTEAMKHQREGMRPNLFEDREAALAAVRAMKAVDARRR